MNTKKRRTMGGFRHAGRAAGLALALAVSVTAVCPQTAWAAYSLQEGLQTGPGSKSNGFGTGTSTSQSSTSQTQTTVTTTTGTSYTTPAAVISQTGPAGETTVTTSPTGTVATTTTGTAAATTTAGTTVTTTTCATTGTTTTAAATTPATTTNTAVQTGYTLVQTANMPQRPTVAAQGALLYDATHNLVLFEQNADTQFYPASITKLMTALLVAENCSLDGIVTFSQTAVSNLESGAVTLQLKAGDQVSVRDCLYGLLLKSANEIGNGLAEYTSGSIETFVELMNQKAAALGCTNTHFANTNGLNNSSHYTTPRDMALIAKAAFDNATVRQVLGTLTYNFPATASVSQVRTLTMGHKMLNPANAEYYTGIIGGKTGYTSLAGNTLVTCVERDGVRLIAVILKSSQTHYSDTKALLDYGYQLVSAGAIQAAQAGVNTGSSSSGPSGQNTSSPGQTLVGAAAYTEALGTWQQSGTIWYFAKSDGRYAASEYLRINGKVYGFDANGVMLTGWQDVGGSWHYFDETNGDMAFSTWINTNGYWYYVDQNGALFVNGTTPDGYQVDQNGVWIQ